MRTVSRLAAISYKSISTASANASSLLPQSALEEIELYDNVPTSRRSAAADYGSAYIGNARLPDELQSFIQARINQCDKELLRQDALDLYKHLRGSSDDPRLATVKRQAQDDPRPKRSLPPYNRNVTLAYAAGIMPSVYAATLHVLKEAEKRLSTGLPDTSWSPLRIIDLGSGTSSAFWAAAAVWPEITHYTAFDDSSAMLKLAENATAAATADLPSAETSYIRASLTNSELWQNLKATAGSKTLVIAAYTLGEISRPRDRQRVIDRIFATGAEVIIFIERGTPAGFRLVADARAQILALGRQSDTKVCHVVAPCPHDGKCPLHHSRDFCHFSQRVERPEYLRKTKHAKIGEEDSKFSYVVLRKGERPKSISSPSALQAHLGPLTEIKDDTLYLEEVHDENSQNPPLFDLPISESSTALQTVSTPSNALHNAATVRRAAYSWPRLVAPPLKRSGHIILDACAPSGLIERFVIPKSQGKQVYHDARKAKWGDTFPHESKHGSHSRRRGVRKLDDMSVKKQQGAAPLTEEDADLPQDMVNEFLSGSLSLSNINIQKLGNTLSKM